MDRQHGHMTDYVLKARTCNAPNMYKLQVNYCNIYSIAHDIPHNTSVVLTFVFMELKAYRNILWMNRDIRSISPMFYFYISQFRINSDLLYCHALLKLDEVRHIKKVIAKSVYIYSEEI